MADKKGRFKYTEPTEYFPDSIMKKYKIGKYAAESEKAESVETPESCGDSEKS